MAYTTLPGNPSLSPSNDHAVPSKRATPLSVPIQSNPSPSQSRLQTPPPNRPRFSTGTGGLSSFSERNNPFDVPNQVTPLVARATARTTPSRPLVGVHAVSRCSFQRKAPSRVP